MFIEGCKWNHQTRLLDESDAKILYVKCPMIWFKPCKMNDVRKVIYGTIIGFFLMLGLWFSIIYVSSCGFTFTCIRGDLPVERTPIPTLIPATLPVRNVSMSGTVSKCQVAAVNLIGAWVSAGYPETSLFTFTDVNLLQKTL